MDTDRAVALAREDVDAGVGRWLPATAAKAYRWPGKKSRT